MASSESLLPASWPSTDSVDQLTTSSNAPSQASSPWLSSSLAASPARGLGMHPVAVKSGPGTQSHADSKRSSLTTTTGWEPQDDPGQREYQASRRHTSGDANQVSRESHPVAGPENLPHPKSISSLRSHQRSMLQECFSDCSSSVYSGPSSTARGIGDIDFIRGDSGSPAGSGAPFQTATRLKTPSTYQTPDGATITFPLYAAHQLVCFSNPEDTQAVFGELLDLTARGEISDEWIMGLVLYPPFLKAVFRLVDTVVPTTKVLQPKSVCARVLEALLTKFSTRFILQQVLGPSLDMDGAVGMRYLIRRGRLKAEKTQSIIRGEDVTVIKVVRHAHKIMHATGLMSAASVQAILLVESMLHEIASLEQIHEPEIRQFVRGVIILLKNKALRRPGEQPKTDAARRVAALHLISTLLRTYKRLMDRLDEEWETPIMPQDDWLLQDLGVSDVFEYLRDEAGDSMVRCMALRVIRDFAIVDAEGVSLWRSLKDVISICVDVLLWKAEWQVGQDDKAKSLEIVKFNPPDDAYQIISRGLPELTTAAMAEGLMVDERGLLVEPLLYLIVEYSKSRDGSWPSVLSILIQSGLFHLLQEILLEPFGLEGDSHYRSACRVKADACICLTRCLEQMQAKDMKAVPADMGETLENLSLNADTPTNVRDFAMNALDALNDNAVRSIIQSRRAGSRQRPTVDSTPISPRHDTPHLGCDHASD